MEAAWARPCNHRNNPAPPNQRFEVEDEARVQALASIL